MVSASDTRDIIEKYTKKLESQLSPNWQNKDYSKEYIKFRGEMIPSLSRYERWARFLGGIIKINVAEKDRIKIQNHLDIAQLNVTASQALTLSIMSFLGVFFLTLLACTAIYLITIPEDFGNILLLGLLGLIASGFIFYHTYSMPARLANAWRLKASAQMVPAILYTVVYMKHTSNLERAISFASENLEGPLALDFKKIFYDVEIGKYSTIKQSLDAYLEKWRFSAPEFIESLHLVESSLFEPTETRRVEILEKALQVILDGVYEKMLHYSREIRSPLTNIYMLGIILPTLGLALLPLASTLLGGAVQWPHVFVIFNIIVPFFVFYMTSQILLKRPGGYGESSILELNPNYHLYISKKPWITASMIAIPLMIIAFLPFILNSGIFGETDISFSNLGINFLGDSKIFDFKTFEGKTSGPFSPFSTLLSLLIPLAIALFFIIAYTKKTSVIIKSREDTQQLESEFTNSLFQLGNRLGDGIPAEIVFGKIAEATRSQKTSEFFSLVNQNIQQAGMSPERAIFDKKRGALIYFPSNLIATSMKILVESVKKGLKVAARSLISISEYVKNIDKITQRLKDLLAEIISDMKSNMTFLAPLLAGIVVGLSSMVTMILNKLSEIQAQFGSDSLGGFSSIGNIVSLFDVNKVIPPYFMQASIGLYVIEIVFILTSALVTVSSGQDSLREKYETAGNLKISISLYLLTALISITGLTALASIALSNL